MPRTYASDPMNPLCLDNEKRKRIAGLEDDYIQRFALHPTVVVFHQPGWNGDYHLYMDYSDLVTLSFHAQFLPFANLSDEYAWDLPDSYVQELIDPAHLTEEFLKDHSLFDYIVDRFRPYVIIIEDLYYDVISAVYPVVNHSIQIAGVEYAFYSLSESKKNESYLTSLAHQEYRGKRFKLVISIDEMKQLVPDLKIPSDENDDD